MPDGEEPRPSAPHNLVGDCLIPAIALAFTLYYLTTITEVPWISQASAVIVGSLLLLSILAFAIRGIARVRRGRETFDVPAAWRALGAEGRTGRTRLALFALTIGYVVFLGVLGFTLSTFVFVFAAIVLLSSPGNWRRALAVALGCAVAGYGLFIHLFGTRFPEGPIERWLEALLG